MKDIQALDACKTSDDPSSAKAFALKGAREMPTCEFNLLFDQGTYCTTPATPTTYIGSRVVLSGLSYAF